MREFWDNLTKKQRFIAILIGLVVLSGIFSVITKVTVLFKDDEDYHRIAVVMPQTGESAVIGRSILQGAELYAEILKEQGLLHDTYLAIDPYDDKNDPEEARKQAELIVKSRAKAVIGHWSSAAAKAAQKVYEEAGIVLMTPSSVDPAVLKDKPWTFSGLFNDVTQAKFMANYTRNVQGHKLISMIVDKRAYGETMGENFAKTALRFGTKVRYTWEIDTAIGPSVPQIKQIVAELKAKKDAGVLFLATNEIDGARLVKFMRDAGVRNPIVGTNALGTSAFAENLKSLPGKSDDVGRYANQMTVVVPLLFDTANEVAQNFKNRYLKQFSENPDWLATYAYDATHTLVEAMRHGITDEETLENKTASRTAIRDYLVGTNSADDAINGVSGITFFNEDGEAQKPVFIGVYNGPDIISALTQLQPIKPGGNRNYIDELRKGRVLYVNDRFMYKTNVVYTGLQVKEITEINREENSYMLDLLIWFRFRGDIEPHSLHILNGADDIVLEKPTDEQKVGDMTYRLYRVKAKFRFNFSDTKFTYGDHLVGIAFTHSKLNKNNLQYVVDVLGVGLSTGETMMDKLEKGKALDPATGWVIDRAWISQDIVPRGTSGDPTYVGYGSTAPEFSQIDLGIVIKKGEIAVRDFIPAEFFIYLGIFALLGSIFAIVMDHKERGRFWHAQSYLLRLMSWPILLLSGGNLLLDFAVQNLPDHYIDIIILAYDTIWWIVPARLLGIALERFLWIPLEDHTERNIPNVIRVFASVTIYAFAGCGIVAFVMGEALTSILASTGLLAMIVGLAVQSNISNIFSGIVINMERPFNVGDWVQIGDTDEGRVVDITWRSTRVKVRNGYVISLPNGQVSDAHIHNFNSFDAIRLELALFLDARYPMMETSDIMEAGLLKAPNLLDSPEPEVRFKGIERHPGAWVAEYEIQFWIEDYGRREEIAEAAQACVWGELAAHNIRPTMDAITDLGALAAGQVEIQDEPEPDRGQAAEAEVNLSQAGE